jgi:hypothetical protein
MRFKCLIRVYDFLQVLHIKWSHSTNNDSFPMYILFTTIYLLQKQKLNHRNYYEQKINMIYVMQATKYDMILYAKFQCMNMHGVV